MPQFTTLPHSINISTDKNTNDWICFTCRSLIDGIHLDVLQANDQVACYCGKCALEMINSQAALFDFMSHETKKLAAHFPKKVKTKHEDININSLL